MRRVIAIASLERASSMFFNPPPLVKVALESAPPGAMPRPRWTSLQNPLLDRRPHPTPVLRHLRDAKFQPVTVPVQVIRIPAICLAATTIIEPSPVFAELSRRHAADGAQADAAEAEAAAAPARPPRSPPRADPLRQACGL